MAKENDTKASDDQWEEVDSPNFTRFENYGDTVEGTLIDKSDSDQFGFGLYTVEQDDGSQLRFHGSAQLDDLMLGVNLGDKIKVEYYDQQKMAKGNMKLFKLLRKRGD